jgi:endonuclease/exonuclease/phosphatase family metal-dependent hydrolase
MNRNGRLPIFILISITTLLGLQTVRVLFALALYVLRDRLGWSAIQIGVLMLAFFALTFLAGLLRRWLGTRPLLAVTAVALSLFRLAMQLWTGDPLVDLILAFLSVFCFTLFLPAILSFLRARSPLFRQMAAPGLLAGFAFDVALYGAFRTYDVAWQGGWLTAVLVILLVVVQWAALRQVLTVAGHEPANPDAKTGLLWLAFGPFLFLQLTIFSNIARLTVISGQPQAAVFFLVLFAHVAAVFLVLWLAERPFSPILAAILGLLLAAALLIPWPGCPAGGVQLFAGQLILALLLALIVRVIITGNGRSGLRALTLGNGFGWLLMAIFVFLYYAGYDIPLPFNNDLLFPLAALATAVCAFFAARALAKASPEPAPLLNWKPALLLLLLLLLPLYQFIAVRPPTAVSGNGFPVKVMTYNLHNGFDPYGNLGLEALAQVIETENPAIVSLQEVNRGWVVNGSTDMLEWLSRRLDMPYVWGPTADPLWGNAILSRYPLNEVDMQPLPPPTLLLQRGFIWAAVDVGGGQRLNVVATHYHHKEDGSLIRTTQSQAILNDWRERPSTLIMGDLNAKPPAPELQIYRNRGFQDALDLNGVLPGYTYDALAPYQRLDYILLTPDLTAVNAAIPTTPASDHLPVTAVISP